MNADWKLALLPTAARVLLTAFLALIGFGYLAALGNLYHQHRLADGKPDLSFDDMRVVFHGMVLGDPGAPRDRTAAPMSRMLEMVEPGGPMRKHLIEGGEPAVNALTAWLRGGAKQAQFGAAGLVQPDDPSPMTVIDLQCLTCHNADSGEKDDAPYGPDMFTVDYEMVYRYAAPGTATGDLESHEREASASGHDHAATDDVETENAPATGSRPTGPMAISRLFLITHVHMLSIPVFTLIVSGLFLMTGWPPPWKGVVAVVPMLTLLFDFAAWWLARSFEPLLYVMAAAGGIYGIVLAVQLFSVLASMWFGCSRSSRPS